MRALAAAAVVVTLAACGSAPAPHPTSADSDTARVRSACRALAAAIEPSERKSHPPGFATAYGGVIDGRCEWVSVGGPTPGVPRFTVGLLADSHGAAVLDQTESVLTSERSVSDVGERATFDPESGTLYVVQNDRLWYLQYIAEPDAPGVLAGLTPLARDFLQLPATR